MKGDNAMRPDTINILGKNIKVEYCEKVSDVDIFKRESLWGQYDPWTHTIRVYSNGRSEDATLSTLLHEILHVIATELHLSSLDDSDEIKHNELDVLALALSDMLIRNNWLVKS